MAATPYATSSATSSPAHERTHSGWRATAKKKRAPTRARSASGGCLRRSEPGLLGDDVGPGAFRLLGDDRVGAAGKQLGDGAFGIGGDEGAVRAFRQLVDFLQHLRLVMLGLGAGL